MRKWMLFSCVVCLGTLAWIIQGCSDSSSRQEADSHIVNTTYYAHLTEAKYVEYAAAQPQFPASGELFSENTSVFRLLPANASALQKLLPEAMLSDFVLYSPASSLKKRVASSIDAPPSLSAASVTTIPSLKQQNVIPESCADLSDAALNDCLDNLGVSSIPISEHVSIHDPYSLAIEAGQSLADSIPGKTVQTVAANITTSDRNAIIAKLTDFTNNDPTHADVDIASFDPFNPAGYSLKSVVISDNSSSDLNSDSVLDQHSTMITEIAKPVAYQRNPASALDSCVQKYGNAINDRYIMKISTYIHLDHLKSQRQTLPVFTPSNSNPVAPPEFYDSVHTAQMMNHALDANLIKSVYGSNTDIPTSSTEYTFMFQIDPNQISSEYAALLEKMSSAGDSECQEMVEQHINPRTAIISGSSTNSPKSAQKGANALSVFYQVPAFYTAHLSAKIASALTGQDPATPAESQLIGDYCMVDGDGRKVAIVDPVTGAIVPACEKLSQKGSAKTVMMTKPGACKGDKGHWAYDPSRLQTSRFGRGIQWIFTEWLLHDQVGDYKNIHWHQSVWKSGVQVAVKGAKIGIATYLKIQVGAINLKNDDGTDKKKSLIYAKAFLPLVASIVMKMDGMSVAGYKIAIPHVIGDFFNRSSNFFPEISGNDSVFGNSTFDYWLLLDLSGGVKGFLIDRIADAAAQMLDVTVVGWQDISDRSHYGCFEFSY